MPRPKLRTFLQALRLLANNPFNTFLAAHLLAAGAVLGGVLWFQYGQGLLPCPLCLWQRVPYVAVLLLAVLGLGLAPYCRSGRVRRGVPWLLGAAYMAGLGLAVYHSGIERHWWQGVTRCSVAGSTPSDLESLRAQILNAVPVRCDEIPWELFGLSLSNYNALASSALLLYCLWGAFCLVPKSK
jgi:disulfide bond formation protein DsbB